eukprot:m.171713 g.171713  ORF g.171713 m.171713 type:complete len:54 (-) comp14558_c1_seq1:629-790(-)
MIHLVFTEHHQSSTNRVRDKGHKFNTTFLVGVDYSDAADASSAGAAALLPNFF